MYDSQLSIKLLLLLLPNLEEEAAKSSEITDAPDRSDKEDKNSTRPLLQFTPLQTLVRMSQIAEDIKEADEERIKSLQRELLQVNEAKEKLVVEKEKLVQELQESRLQHNLLTDKNQKLTVVQASRNKEVVKQTVAEDKIRKLNTDLEQKIGVLTEENYLLQGTLESLRAALDDLETKHQKNEASALKACMAIRAFRGQNDPLSNFFFVGTQKLLYKGRTYSSSEQAYQHTRALFHEEKQIAKEIIGKEVNPHGMKNLGGRITASKAWNDIKADVMYEILEAKAACSAVFCEALKTEDPQVVFVEAVYDDFWGSGLPYIETCTRSPGKWPGSNMMGRLLSKLRGNMQAITCLSPTRKQTATASNTSHMDMHPKRTSQPKSTPKSSSQQSHLQLSKNLSTLNHNQLKHISLCRHRKQQRTQCHSQKGMS